MDKRNGKAKPEFVQCDAEFNAKVTLFGAGGRTSGKHLDCDRRMKVKTMARGTEHCKTGTYHVCRINSENMGGGEGNVSCMKISWTSYKFMRMALGMCGVKPTSFQRIHEKVNNQRREVNRNVTN